MTITIDELKAWVKENIYSIKLNNGEYLMSLYLLEKLDQLDVGADESKLERYKTDAILCNKLCTILVNYIGETGMNESAVGVLERLLSERKDLMRKHNNQSINIKDEREKRLKAERKLAKYRDYLTFKINTHNVNSRYGACAQTRETN